MKSSSVTPRKDARAAFYATMSRLQADFSKAAVDVAAREGALTAALDAVEIVMKAGVGDGALAKGHSLSRVTEDFNAQLKKAWKDWRQSLDSYDRGTVFRSNFNDSLVVFVLGKVKAGKSSLGNYMAHGHPTPGKEDLSGKAKFFTYAATGTKGDPEPVPLKSRHFAVGVSETTSTIQGFRLPGLTWVDAPGLGSMTKENGKLAKEYAGYADLIIYPTASGAPGRNGDALEIGVQIGARKRLVVLITQADKMEMDEDEDGEIVRESRMKTAEEQRGQVEYVRKALKDTRFDPKSEIIPVSVKWAAEHGNTPQALQESGLADFFRLLTQVAHSNGVHLKLNAPSNKLDAFVKHVLDGDGTSELPTINSLQEKLREVAAALAAAERLLEKRREAVLVRVSQHLPKLVDELAERHAAAKDTPAFVADCKKELKYLIVAEILTEINKLLGQRDQPLIKSFDVRVALEVEDFADETVRVLRDNSSMGGVLGGGLGALIGGLLFGPIGAVVGGVLGGGAGSAAAGSTEEEVKTGGDNRGHVKAKACAALRAEAEKNVKIFFDMLIKERVTVTKTRLSKFETALKKFETSLKTKVHSNG